MKKKIFHTWQFLTYIAYAVFLIILSNIVKNIQHSQTDKIIDTYSQILSPYGYEYTSYGSYSNSPRVYIYERRESDNQRSSIDIRIDSSLNSYFVNEYNIYFRNCYDERIYDIVDALPQPYGIREYKDDIENAVNNYKVIDDYVRIGSSYDIWIIVSNRTGSILEDMYSLQIQLSYRKP